jgi:alpha-beta hydrolase superfamily lysophospholipase
MPKKRIFILFSCFASALMLSCLSAPAKDSFSFKELSAAPEMSLGEPDYLTSNDGARIAYYWKSPATKPSGVLLFIHGGGAYSNAGYQYLANGLSRKYGIATCLMDVRGHGKSDGPRGDSPTIEQVWIDVKLMVDYIRTVHPSMPLLLGGHSSGCGLMLNYLSWEGKSPVDGYVFLSPHFGYLSNTERTSDTPFARVSLDVFVANAKSQGREYGNTPAVFFNYSEAVLRGAPLLLKYITCNMANATTPYDPRAQFKAIDQRFGIFIGADDELFYPEKVIKYADLAPKAIRSQSTAEVIKGKNHLSILLGADDLINRIFRQ